MAKPPTAVRSIRLPVEQWERIAKAAKAKGLTVNAYVASRLALSEDVAPTDAAPETVGAASEGQTWSDADIAKMRSRPRPPLVIRKIATAPKPVAHKSRLKGEWKAP